MATTRNMAGRLTRALRLAALALVFAMCSQSRTTASILQLDADDVLASVFDEPSSSGAADHAPVPARPFETPAPTDDGSDYVYNVESPGTTGTSSSSPSPGSFGSSVPCVMCETLSLDENPIVVRLALSQSFFLPTPPGVDLLRPPRGSR
jgi:hypothetical protein